MTHDPLCPMSDPERADCCCCSTIARVRAQCIAESNAILPATLAAEESIIRERIAQEDVLDACRHWAGVDPNPCATCERIAARIARGGDR